MGANMGRLICNTMILGEEALAVITTANNLNVGNFVKQRPGIGKPFWYWPSIPSGKVVACDFSNAPIVTADTAANNAAIAAITTLPEDVLTYETPTP